MEDLLNYFLDPNFRFNEATHTYTYVDPKSGMQVQTFSSVTGFISQFKEKFDSKTIASRVAKKRGVSPSAILEEWKGISDTAMDLGTDVHKWIEDYYNGTNPAEPTHPGVLSRVNFFRQIHAERLYKLAPVKQEFRLFSRKWGLAGTMDALFRLGHDYYVGDWKTNKKFTTDDDSAKDKYAKKLLYPFEDLWDNSVNGYSIQLSMYRLLLQEEANFRTEGAFLVWIGPNEKPKIYKTVDLRDRLYTYLQKNNPIL